MTVEVTDTGSPDATKSIAEFGKQEVIELIIKMKDLDRKYAEIVYLRENARCPEWDLKQAIKDALKAKE